MSHENGGDFSFHLRDDTFHRQLLHPGGRCHLAGGALRSQISATTGGRIRPKQGLYILLHHHHNQIHIDADGIVHLHQAEHGGGRLHAEIGHQHFFGGSEPDAVGSDAFGFYIKNNGLGDAGNGELRRSLEGRPVFAGRKLGFLQLGAGQFYTNAGVLVGAQGFVHVFVHLRIAAIQRLGTEVEAGMGEAEGFAAVLQLKADGAFGKLLGAVAGKLIDIAGAGNAEAAACIYVIGGFEAGHEGNKRR